jgi:hypothetical protein
MSAPFFATAPFWKAASERAVKTFGQSIGAMLIGDGLGVLNVDWQQTLSVSGLAVLASVASSLASGALTDGGPSITNAESPAAVAKADDESPTGEVAGPASDLPTGTPTVTERAAGGHDLPGQGSTQGV